jgi:hypothetical protein
MVGTPPDAFASAGFAHPTGSERGEAPDADLVGWAKARLRAVPTIASSGANGGHAAGRIRVRRLCLPYGVGEGEELTPA